MSIKSMGHVEKELAIILRNGRYQAGLFELCTNISSLNLQVTECGSIVVILKMCTLPQDHLFSEGLCIFPDTEQSLNLLELINMFCSEAIPDFGIYLGEKLRGSNTYDIYLTAENIAKFKMRFLFLLLKEDLIGEKGVLGTRIYEEITRLLWKLREDEVDKITNIKFDQETRRILGFKKSRAHIRKLVDDKTILVPSYINKPNDFLEYLRLVMKNNIELCSDIFAIIKSPLLKMTH